MGGAPFHYRAGWADVANTRWEATPLHLRKCHALNSFNIDSRQNTSLTSACRPASTSPSQKATARSNASRATDSVPSYRCWLCGKLGARTAVKVQLCLTNQRTMFGALLPLRQNQQLNSRTRTVLRPSFGAMFASICLCSSAPVRRKSAGREATSTSPRSHVC